MSPDIVGRLFGYEHAFADPVTRLAVTVVVAVFLLIPLVVAFLAWRKHFSETTQGEIWRRYRSWLIIAPLMLAPILAGAFWTILGILLLSLACCREFGRATGLFREQHKTVEGALGALVLTTALVVLLGAQVFRETPLDSVLMLAGLGALISAAGQLGDLMLSSIKRDLGLKDMGAMIPGHGGLLDRFDSLILVAPAAFHYIGYLIGFGLDQQERILTGG